MTGEKTTKQVCFVTNGPEDTSYKQEEEEYSCEGYEIHMGVTEPVEGVSGHPLNKLSDGRMDGFRVNATCMGTYVHGILDNPSFIDQLLKPFADKLSEVGSFDHKNFKEEQYNKLSSHVRSHVNMPLIYKILTAHD